jgi:hypothetical protein
MQIPKITTTVGVLEPPLGNMRLAVAKLLSALLARNSPAIAKEIVMLDMFSTLIVSIYWYTSTCRELVLCNLDKLYVKLLLKGQLWVIEGAD